MLALALKVPKIMASETTKNSCFGTHFRLMSPLGHPCEYPHEFYIAWT